MTSQNLEGRGRRVKNSRPASATQQIPGQSGLYKTCPNKQDKRQTKHSISKWLSEPKCAARMECGWGH